MSSSHAPGGGLAWLASLVFKNHLVHSVQEKGEPLAHTGGTAGELVRGKGRRAGTRPAGRHAPAGPHQGEAFSRVSSSKAPKKRAQEH